MKKYFELRILHFILTALNLIDKKGKEKEGNQLQEDIVKLIKIIEKE